MNTHYLMSAFIRFVFVMAVTSLLGRFSFGKPELLAESSKPSTIVLLYTFNPTDSKEEYENLTEVANFGFERYELETHKKLHLKIVAVDDRDSPQHAEEALRKVVTKSKPVAVIGPLYSNVAMGLKDYINEIQVPMMSIFATHNDLTKGSQFMFRICASNRRVVKSMADFLIPIVEEGRKKKISYHIKVFKDITDDYSTDLADTFRYNTKGFEDNTEEILFRGLGGLERLRDLNANVWKPTKQDIYFLPVRDLIAGHIISSLESEPFLVTAIDTVNFLNLVNKMKNQKTHTRLVTTSQWIPQKSDYSKTIEAAFRARFKRDMTITSALTFDAAYTIANAYGRSQDRGVLLVDSLRDSTKMTGVTGLILIQPDGERLFSDQFLKDEFIE